MVAEIPDCRDLEAVVKEYFSDKNISLASVGFLLLFSGGVDSSVLLRVMLRLVPREKVQLLYVDYALRGEESQREAEGISAFCKQEGIHLHLISHPLKKSSPGGNLQSLAREFRYRKAKEIASPGGEYILTAHHRDDRLETLFSKLLKGQSPASLIAWDASERVLRPLSRLPKSAIESYARKEKIPFFFDSSNHQDLYERNYIRNRVFPLLDERFPDWRENFVRSTNFIFQAVSLLDRSLVDKSFSKPFDVLPPFPPLLEMGEGLALEGFLLLEGFGELSRREREYLIHSLLYRHFPEQRFSRNEVIALVDRLGDGDREIFRRRGGSSQGKRFFLSRGWVATPMVFSEEAILPDIRITMDIFAGEEKLFSDSLGFLREGRGFLSEKILLRPLPPTPGKGGVTTRLRIELPENRLRSSPLSPEDDWSIRPLSEYRKSSRVGSKTLKKHLESLKFPVQIRSALIGLAHNGELIGAIDLWRYTRRTGDKDQGYFIRFEDIDGKRGCLFDARR